MNPNPPATPTRQHQPPARAALAAALALLCGGPVLAQTSPWYLGASQSLTYLSNVYQVDEAGENQLKLEGLRKADTVSGTALVGGLDQAIGRQRLSGSADVRANRYSHNKSLDNDSYRLNLALDWSTVQRLSGTLSLSADQNLAQFGLGANGQQDTRRNVVRTRQVESRVRLGGVTRLTFEAGLSHRKRSYSDPSNDNDEFSQTSASLGLRYRQTPALLLGASLRISNARYPRFQTLVDGRVRADTLKRQDIDLTASWRPGGASQLDLRLSPTRSRYDRNTVKDFSGLTGSVNWAWQATGKSRLTTSFSRDTGQSLDAVNLFGLGAGLNDQSRTTTALALRAQHELTGKVSVSAGITQAHRALDRTILNTAGNRLDTVSDSDRTTSLSLGARWLPTRSTQLACDIGQDHRRTGKRLLSVSYDATSLSCYGQIVLQ